MARKAVALALIFIAAAVSCQSSPSSSPAATPSSFIAAAPEAAHVPVAATPESLAAASPEPSSPPAPASETGSPTGAPTPSPSEPAADSPKGSAATLKVSAALATAAAAGWLFF